MAYIIPVLIAIFVSVFVIVGIYVKKEEQHGYDRIKTGPFAIAVIESVEEKTRTISDRIRHYYECAISYLDAYGNERKATIDMYYSDIPVGGEIKIAYDPEDFTKVYLAKALFMNTPEYIQMMKNKGFVKTPDGFERKDKVLYFEKK